MFSSPLKFEIYSIAQSTLHLMILSCWWTVTMQMLSTHFLNSTQSENAPMHHQGGDLEKSSLYNTFTVFSFREIIWQSLGPRGSSFPNLVIEFQAFFCSIHRSMSEWSFEHEQAILGLLTSWYEDFSNDAFDWNTYNSWIHPQPEYWFCSTTLLYPIYSCKTKTWLQLHPKEYYYYDNGVVLRNDQRRSMFSCSSTLSLFIWKIKYGDIPQACCTIPCSRARSQLG